MLQRLSERGRARPERLRYHPAPVTAPVPLSALARLSVAVVQGRWELLGELLDPPPAPDERVCWREALLQVHLFAGFPRVVEAWGVVERAGGLGEPSPAEVRAEPDRPEQGSALFGTIYAEQAERVEASLQGFHPELARWVLGHAYGRVLARPWLSAAERELLAVACLAALGQDRQLASHVRGALRCGASAVQLRAVLESVADLLGDELHRRMLRVSERFLPEVAPPTEPD